MKERTSNDDGNGKPNIPSGLAVDSKGNPVVDPTKNVLQLVEAAIQRQDDLRSASEKFTEAQIENIKEAARIQFQHYRDFSTHETNRIDAMRNSQLQHVEEMARLRELHTRELLVAEASRINAIREVDVGSVSTAAARQDQQAVVLANQVAASAETLRALVATTNSSVANTLAQITTQLTERISQVEKASSDRIALLEKSSYEGKGKEAVSDPMVAQMVTELRNLRSDVTTSAGKGAGIEKAWGWLVAAAGSGGVAAFLVDKMISK